MVQYNYAKLKGLITEVCGTQAEFAARMGLSERTISLKLNNKIVWDQGEIDKAKDILGFSDSDVWAIFFKKEVQFR